jgi:hypothetical protein
MTIADEMKVSRRNLAQRAVGAVAGMIAGSTFVGADIALAAPAVSAARREELGNLSHKLYTSPNERQTFLANPSEYVRKLGLKNVPASDVHELKSMMAKGHCCHGCGCDKN